MQLHNADLRYLLDKEHWDGEVIMSISDSRGKVITFAVPVTYDLIKAWEASLTPTTSTLWREDVAARAIEAKRTDEAQHAEIQAVIAKKALEQQAEINALKKELTSRKRKRAAEPEEEEDPVTSNLPGLAHGLRQTATGLAEMGRAAGVLS